MAASPSTEPPLDWDLSDLYQDFWDPRYAQDLADIQERTRSFRSRYRTHVAALRPKEVLTALQEIESIWEQCSRRLTYPTLRFITNTQEAETKYHLDQTQMARIEIENQLVFFDLELQALPPATLAAWLTDPWLADYAHYLKRIATLRPYHLEEQVEQVLNQTALTGRIAWAHLHTIHLASQAYPPVTTPEGQTASTETEINALLHHPSAEVRLSAYVSVRQILETHNALYAEILNTILRDYRFDALRRGYDSCLAHRLFLDEIPEPVFEALMEGTRDRFDLFQRYYRLKGRTLGRSIRLCDLRAPWNEPFPKIPYPEGVNILIQALQTFSPEYAQQAKPFFEHAWIDAAIRPGKQRETLCLLIKGWHSYLSLSYTNTYASLFDLAHAIGHGIHYERIRTRQRYLNSHPPTVLAELAGIFNQLLLLDDLITGCDDPEQIQTLLAYQLEDHLDLLFHQSTISRLELILHQRSAQGGLSRDFINQEWLKVYQELCGDAVELLPEHQFDWAQIGHLFSRPFHCYSHTLSFVIAIACYQLYQQQGDDFIPKYLNLLDLGGSQSPAQALKSVGIDLLDPMIIHQTTDYIEQLIDQLEEILDR